MISFKVNDMTCGHCAGAITRAVKAVDKGASVQVDLRQHLVTVQPTEADASELLAAITEAGYTPVAVHSPIAAEPARAARGCCGSCR
jgi:copper chaperone